MRAVCVGMLLIAMTVAGCASSSGESYAATGYNFASLDKVAIVEVTGRVYGDAAKNLQRQREGLVLEFQFGPDVSSHNADIDHPDAGIDAGIAPKSHCRFSPKAFIDTFYGETKMRFTEQLDSVPQHQCRIRV